MAAPARSSAANRLLAALPRRDREHVLRSCDSVELAFADVLSAPGKRMRYVYFPMDSIVSLGVPVDGFASLEVGLVGNEGMVGIPVALGVNVSALHALVQGPGPALRMDVALFLRELERSDPLRRALMRYVQVLMTQLVQTAACTHFHFVEARLARWLLMTQDRAHSDAFRLTHEFLAYILGVRRVGVTKAAGCLQKRKLIRYSRGEISILDRRGLIAAACRCYLADMATYDGVLGA